MRIFTPLNNVKLEGVSIVCLKKGGKRFEVVCYTNIIQDYKNEIVKDICFVVQTETVFCNVSKGLVANKKDLLSVFGKKSNKEIIEEILKKGEIQFSQEERKEKQEKMFKEVSFLISEACVNPETKNKYPQKTIERAMKKIQVSLDTSKSSKQQTLKVIQKLCQSKIIPIERRKILLNVETKNYFYEKLKKAKSFSIQETFLNGEKLSFSVVCETFQFNSVSEEIKEITEGEFFVNFQDSF